MMPTDRWKLFPLLGQATSLWQSIPGEDGPGMHIRRKTRGKSHQLRFWLSLALFITVASSVVSLFAYQQLSACYRSYILLAQSGVDHLWQAALLIESLPHNPFDSAIVNHAKQEFTRSLSLFEQLNSGLSSFPGIAQDMPVYDARLNAAMRLSSLALDASQAGIVGCDALDIVISAYHKPLSTGSSGSQGLTCAKSAQLTRDFQRLETALGAVIANADQVQPSDLSFSPHLSTLFASFQQKLPQVRSWLQDAEQLFPVLPSLLGIRSPTSYLLELQDSSELRPTGGFIGNIGLLTLADGRVQSVHVSDVDLLDKPFNFSGHRILFPPQYRWFHTYLATNGWSLRDSNLDADFPTAAQYAELDYHREGGTVAVQGVIAITPALIQQAMTITGPIYLPEYGETVTPQNLIDRIHYHQLGLAIEGNDFIASPDGHSSLRQRFTELLAEHFMARQYQLPGSALASFAHLFAQAMTSRDIQVYFNAQAAESLLHAFHLDGTIQAPDGDSLFVVDTNVAGDKANSFITSSLHDSVTIDASGNAHHSLTLMYAWTVQGNVYGHALYKDYARLYAPPRSILQAQSGWEPHGTSLSFGREVWTGFFTLVYGQTRTLHFTWTVPTVIHSGDRHYQYFIQHQARTSWHIHAQVACTGKTSGASGMTGTAPARQLVLDTIDSDVTITLGDKGENEMIDTHLHILPGVDDGPATLNESLDLARSLVQESVHTVIATPHYNDQYPRHGAVEIVARVYELQQALYRSGIPLRAFASHEVLIKPGLVEDIQMGRVCTLASSRYLLLELWNTGWVPATEQVIFELQAFGVIPLIAHPERYTVFQKDSPLLASLVRQGVLPQVTLGALVVCRVTPFDAPPKLCSRRGLFPAWPRTRMACINTRLASRRAWNGPANWLGARPLSRWSRLAQLLFYRTQFQAAARFMASLRKLWNGMVEGRYVE